METNPTPGKWITSINKINGNGEVFVKVENKSAIAIMFKKNDTVKSKEEAIANAKLISAAPDLLDALKRTQDIITSLFQDYGSIAEIHNRYIKGEYRFIQDAIDNATR